jgi:hypothetical protein
MSEDELGGGLTAEMVAALKADGEKLRALTGEDHGPMIIELAIPRTAEERLAREADSIWGLIKRIEARASDGRFYHLEDDDREKAIAYLKGYAKTHSKVLSDVGALAAVKDAE